MNSATSCPKDRSQRSLWSVFSAILSPRPVNLKQKTVVWLGLLLIVAMGLCPPWVQRFKYDPPRYPFTHQAYSWIWRPPGAPGIEPALVPSQDATIEETIIGKFYAEKRRERRERKARAFWAALRSPQYWETHIDISRLAVQWAIVAILVSGLVWTLAGKPPPRISQNDSQKPEQPTNKN